jgi:hypothetical protein
LANFSKSEKFINFTTLKNSSKFYNFYFFPISSQKNCWGQKKKKKNFPENELDKYGPG